MRLHLLAAIAAVLFIAGIAMLANRSAERSVSSPTVGLPVATAGDIFSRL